MTHKEMYSHRDPQGHEEYFANKLDSAYERYQALWEALDGLDAKDYNAWVMAQTLREIILHLQHGYLGSAFVAERVVSRIVRQS